ncbi:MalM family protein [Marinobacter sp. SS21]|uniref:MalM family protein n=1 Tax=Marinobacter sp. SS21 TaxID=2979460 RepID=UPI00232B4109|nr:MalM family protein [Marinobacter sp. SS21]MDC0662067.1 MalM family protein [Marinobacter sp. SS21]
MGTRRAVRRSCLALVLTLTAVGLTGCQSAGGLQGQGADYFTWVDEQGRVRQTPIGSKPDEAVDERPIEVVAAQAPAPAQPAPAEHDQYNLENYPDGNELEAAGFVREGAPQPYFTWRDAQGNVRVSYYRPDTKAMDEDATVMPPVALTPASIYHASDRAPLQPGAGDTPAAFRVLGIEAPKQSEFQRWASQCCERLGLIQVEEWQSGREFSVRVDGESPTHDFSSGRSRYRLIRLPPDELPPSFVLRLRSFNDEGLFVPSVAFLDSSLEPVRIVTDLVAAYTPESWHSHGYLQAYLPVFPARGERWLLLYTRDTDLNNQTVVDDGPRPRVIPHRQAGLLGLRATSE